MRIPLKLPLLRRQAGPAVPAGLRVYAVGDLHGRLDLLESTLAMIDRDLEQFPTTRSLCIFLGDYIDRGPASRQVIDRLIELAGQRECLFIKGNHELLAMRSLADLTVLEQWLRLGGHETLSSYGLKVPMKVPVGSAREIMAGIQRAFHEALPQPHIKFFRNLKSSFDCGDYFFAHAGVRPGVALADQNETDLLWIRDDFLSSDANFGKIVVHGHTPALAVELKHNRINIDTGAYATDRLTTLGLEDNRLFSFDTSRT